MKAFCRYASFLVALLTSAISSAGDVVEVNVAPSGYNRFVFSEPYNRIVTPPQTKLDKEPVALANNRAFLLDLSSKFPEGLFLVVELESGETIQFNLRQDSSQQIPITWRQAGASEKGVQAETEVDERASTEWVVKNVWRPVAVNKVPEGFSRAKAHQNPIHVVGDDGTSVLLEGKPLGVWDGPSLRLTGYALLSKKTVPVAEHDFYGPGVVSVFLEADSVSPSLSPRLYILSEMNDGQ